MKREIIIFANSLKHKQRCVAGKCITTKEWIRPVSTYNGDAINVEDTFVLNIRKNQKWPLKLLQRAEITFSQAAPLINHQPENLVVSNHPWIDKYKIEKNEIIEYLDFPSDLWGIGNSVGYQDKNKGCVQQILSSLYLIRVSNLKLYTNNFNEKKRPRASFSYNSINYDLAVTCLAFNDYIKTCSNYDSAILCISLGEPYSVDNRCYKLVASIYIGGF